MRYRRSNIIVFGLHLDELGDFEQNWKANADKYLPGWDKNFSLLENQGRLFDLYLSSLCHSYPDIIHKYKAKIF